MNSNSFKTIQLRALHELTIRKLTKYGQQKDQTVRSTELKTFLEQANIKLPQRDVRQLQRPTASQCTQPVILSRPKSHCYVLEIEQIRLVCLQDSVYVFNPTGSVVQQFIAELTKICSMYDEKIIQQFDVDFENQKPTQR